MENAQIPLEPNVEIIKLKQEFEQLYKEHLQVLCLTAFRILHDKEKAHDCVHELFLELWEHDKILYLLEREDVGAYLFSCVQNKCFRIQKSQNKQNEQTKDLILLQEDTAFQNHQEHIASEMLLPIAVKNMPSQPYRALILHVIEGKKRKDVAEEMGISINTLKTHLKIAFRIARENIAKNSKEPHPKTKKTAL